MVSEVRKLGPNTTPGPRATNKGMVSCGCMGACACTHARNGAKLPLDNRNRAP